MRLYFFVQLSRKSCSQRLKELHNSQYFFFNVFAATYRKSLLKIGTFTFFDCTAFKLFKAATVHNAITVFQNNHQEVFDVGYKNTLSQSFEELVGRETLRISTADLELNNVNWGLVFKLSRSFVHCFKD